MTLEAFRGCLEPGSDPTRGRWLTGAVDRGVMMLSMRVFADGRGSLFFMAE